MEEGRGQKRRKRGEKRRERAETGLKPGGKSRK